MQNIPKIRTHLQQIFRFVLDFLDFKDLMQGIGATLARLILKNKIFPLF